MGTDSIRHFFSGPSGLARHRRDGANELLHQAGEAGFVALQDRDLALLQPVTADGNSVTVTTVILHASGAKFDSSLTLTATGPATPQALGSLISYARRYGAGSLLGIVSDPDADDDANAASAPTYTSAATREYDRWIA